MDLEAIRARHTAATKGPWFFSGYSGVFTEDDALIAAEDALITAWSEAGYPKDDKGRHEAQPWRKQLYEAGTNVCWIDPEYGDTATGRHAADGDFIANTWQDIKDLLDEVALLRAAVEGMK